MDTHFQADDPKPVKKRMPKRYVVWGATAVFSLFVLVVIFVANRSTTTGILAPLYAFPGGDKVGHFMLMGTLSFLVNLSLRLARFRLGRGEFLKGSFLVALFVTAEELTQQYIPSRTFSLLDLAVDYAGIVLFGQAVVYAVAKIRAR